MPQLCVTRRISSVMGDQEHGDASRSGDSGGNAEKKAVLFRCPDCNTGLPLTEVGVPGGESLACAWCGNCFMAKPWPVIPPELTGRFKRLSRREGAPGKPSDSETT